MDNERKAAITARMALSRLALERATDRLVESWAEAAHQMRLFGDAMKTANAKSGGRLFRGELD